MAEYIDREALLSELQEEIEFEAPMYTEEQNRWFNRGLRCAIGDVKSQSKADVVEVKAVESWLYEIAINNVGCEFDGDVSEVCKEIISRLDGLRKYAQEKEMQE